MNKSEFFTASELKAAINAVTQKVLQKETYRDQLKYLRKIKKPYEMNIEEFMRRQEFIIFTLSLFGPDAKTINKKVQNKDILIDNLPEHIMVEFRKKRIYKEIFNKDKKNKPSNKDIKEKLEEIEEYTTTKRKLWSRQPDRDRP